MILNFSDIFHYFYKGKVPKIKKIESMYKTGLIYFFIHYNGYENFQNL